MDAQTTAVVDVNGIPITTDSTGVFADSVSLSAGTNVLAITATDPANNQTVVVRTVILDADAPALTLNTPADSSFVASRPVTVSGTVTDATATTMDVNGVNLSVDGVGAFSGDVTLTEAPPLTVTATDAAGNEALLIRTVTLDSATPFLTVTVEGGCTPAPRHPDQCGAPESSSTSSRNFPSSYVCLSHLSVAQLGSDLCLSTVAFE